MRAFPSVGKFRREFWIIWLSVILSAIGDGMRYVSLPLLAADISTDPREVSLVVLAGSLPWPLLSLYAGGIADRHDRRRMLWLTDGARFIVALTFAFLVMSDLHLIATIVAVVILLDIGQKFYNAAWSGIIPMVTASEERLQGNALLQSGSVVANVLIGTPVGSLLFAVSSVIPFYIDAASYFMSAALMFILPGSFKARASKKPESAARPSAKSELTAGARWLWRDPLLRRVWILGAMSRVGFFAQLAIMALYAKEVFHLTNAEYGLIVAAFGIGSLLSALIAPRLNKSIGAQRSLLASILGAAFCAAGLAVARSAEAFAAIFCLYGTAASMGVVTVRYFIQRSADPEILSRVTMTFYVVANGGGMLGSLVGGIIAAQFGLRAPFYLGAGILLATFVCGAAFFRSLLRSST